MHFSIFAPNKDYKFALLVEFPTKVPAIGTVNSVKVQARLDSILVENFFHFKSS